MSKEAFENAVAALVEATRPGKANVQAATTANRTLLAECDGLDQPALNLALTQLAEGLAMRGVEHPALLATACAALVERGGNHRIALDPLLNRLEEAAREALAFVRVCRMAAGAPAEGPADDAACIREHGADQAPKRGEAWRSLFPLCQAANTMLGRTRQAVIRARAHPALPALCRRLAKVREDSVLPPLRSLSRMLDVLHDFPSAIEALVDPEPPGQLAMLACVAVEHDAATVDAESRESALRRLAEGLRDDRLFFAALLTRACEVLIEHGGDPALVLDALLDRLADTVPLAAEFVAACRAQYDADAGRGPKREVDDEECIIAMEQVVREQLPRQGWAWVGLSSMCQSLMGLLSGSASARRAARANPALLSSLQKITETCELDMLQLPLLLLMIVRVLDDEEAEDEDDN